MTRRNTLAAPSISLALVLAACSTTAVAADEPPTTEPRASAAERLLDLSPERVAAFRRTLREFGGSVNAEEWGGTGLFLESGFQTPQLQTLPEDGSLFPEDETLTLPIGVQGRDVIHDEQYLIEGREDDFEDAAEKWMQRKLKGSDAAASNRGGRFAPKFGWSGGPMVGFRRGPFSAIAGEEEWKVRWTHKMARPGWVTRVSAGVDEGEEKIAFTIGRSLFHATTGKR